MKYNTAVRIGWLLLGCTNRKLLNSGILQTLVHREWHSNGGLSPNHHLLISEVASYNLGGPIRLYSYIQYVSIVQTGMNALSLLIKFAGPFTYVTH